VFFLLVSSVLWVCSHAFEEHISPQGTCTATGQQVVTAQSLAHMRSAAAAGQAAYPENVREGPNLDKPSLDIVAVVQTCPTCEANAVIPSYDVFFQGVVSWHWATHPSQDNLKLFHNETSGRWEFSCGSETQHDKALYRTAYVTLCMPKFIAQLPQAFPGATGMFTFNADFWIQPAVIFGPTWAGAWSNLIHLGQGLANPVSIDWDEHMVLVPYPHCFESAVDHGTYTATNGTKWNWPSNCPWQQLDELTVALSKAPHERAKCCAGWADAWYLPIDTWEDFLSITTHYGDDNSFTQTNHEIMVHTLLGFLARHRGHPLRVMTECWGSCCSNIKEDYAELERYPCGHKIELLNNNSRTAMISMLHQQALQFNPELQQQEVGLLAAKQSVVMSHSMGSIAGPATSHATNFHRRAPVRLNGQLQQPASSQPAASRVGQQAHSRIA